MPAPELYGFDSKKILDEVLEVVEGYERENLNKIYAIDRYWRLYKGARDKPRPLYGEVPFEAITNSFVYETPRAVDSLSSTRYRLMMSHDPPFEVISQRGDIDEGDLFKQSSLHSFQMEKVKYPRYLRKTLTSLDLIGNAAVELSWMQFPYGSPSPYWEATSFMPKPLSQIFFSANAITFEDADAKGTLDIVTDARLHRMISEDPNEEAWIHSGIQQAIDDGDNRDFLPDSVRRRLLNAGHKNFKGLKELIIFYGPLPGIKSWENWTVGIADRKHVVKFHPAVLPWAPILFGFTNEIEQEAWALGVGPKAEHLQRMLNANRDRIFNVILFSLFSMMKMSRYAGIRQSDLRIKPFNVIPMDDINGLEKLGVDINSATFGIKMEEMLKDEFQSVTGASKNLEAITTGVTATESQLVMDSTQRRIAVDTEIIADIFLRDYLYYSHKMNELFLDQPIWFNVVGRDGNKTPMRMMPDEIQREIDFRIKIASDKDFRPQMARRIIEFLQTITSIKQQLPQDLQMNLEPYIESFTRLMGIDPRKVFPKEVSPLPQALKNLSVFATGTQHPPMSAMQQAVVNGVMNNQARFSAQREPVLDTRQGGFARAF